MQGEQIGIGRECAGARYTKAAMMAARARLRQRWNQMRLNTSVPLVPPKPKPLDITTSTLASRAVLGT